MKTKALIICLLIVAQIGAFTLKANAQQKDVYVKPDPSFSRIEILADETTLSYTDKYAKIECDNDSVFMKIFKTHYQLIIRFTAPWKNDRHGRYKHYTIYLNKEDAEIIKLWAKNNL